MEAVQDESLKEQMVKVRESMDEEMLKAGAGIWNGVWHGMVISTWIWGFVLFDTMASVEGVEKGLWLLIGMIAFPFIVNVVLHLIKAFKKRYVVRADDGVEREGGLSMKDGYWLGNDSTITMTSNPILNRDSCIEMRSSKMAKNEMDGKLRVHLF
jgi:hypothetical protein